MNRLGLALGIYALLAVLSWFTLGDQRIRIIAIAILAMFAVRTWTFSKRHPESKKRPEDRDPEE